MAETERTTIQEGQPLQTGGPGGGLVRNIATDAIEAGFGFLGSAFAEEFRDPSLAHPFRQMGSNIASTLHDRWWRKEYEDFAAEYSTNYKTRASELNKKATDQFNMINRGVFVDENGVAQKIDPIGNEASLLKENITRTMYRDFGALTTEYMQSASKYGSNPYVNKDIMDLMAAQSQEIQQLFGPNIATQQEGERAKMMAAREEAGYKSRMPVESGSETAARMKSMSLEEIIAEKGLSGAASYLNSTEDGLKRTDTYYMGLSADLEQSLIEEYESAKAEGKTKVDILAESDLRQRLVYKHEKELRAQAVGQALQESLGIDNPELEQFFNSEKGKIYRPKETSRASEPTRENRSEMTMDYRDLAMYQVDELIAQGVDAQTAVEEIIADHSRALGEKFGRGSKTTREIRAELMKSLQKHFLTPKKRGLLGDPPKKEQQGLMKRAPGFLPGEMR